MTSLRKSIALLAPLVLLSAACEGRRAPSAGTPEAGGETAARAYPNPRPKPDFTLTDTEGQPFAFREATEGQMTLVFFGYTSCPDICPLHMANIAAALNKLPDAVARQVTVVFITTDPDRDTPEVIRTWLDHFDRRFIGLTGTQAQVDSAQAAMHLPTAYKEAPLEGRPYTVAHSAIVVAFTRDGMARFAVPYGTRQSEWAQEIPRLVAYPDTP